MNLAPHNLGPKRPQKFSDAQKLQLFESLTLLQEGIRGLAAFLECSECSWAGVSNLLLGIDASSSFVGLGHLQRPNHPVVQTLLRTALVCRKPSPGSGQLLNSIGDDMATA